MRRAPSLFPAKRRPYRVVRRLASIAVEATEAGEYLLAARACQCAEQIARRYYLKEASK